jgi:hypothetical protein
VYVRYSHKADMPIALVNVCFGQRSASCVVRVFGAKNLAS